MSRHDDKPKQPCALRNTRRRCFCKLKPCPFNFHVLSPPTSSQFSMSSFWEEFLNRMVERCPGLFQSLPHLPKKNSNPIRLGTAPNGGPVSPQGQSKEGTTPLPGQEDFDSSVDETVHWPLCLFHGARYSNAKIFMARKNATTSSGPAVFCGTMWGWLTWISLGHGIFVTLPSLLKHRPRLPSALVEFLGTEIPRMIIFVVGG